MTIIGNNDLVTVGSAADYQWEHTVQSLDSAVCPANAILDSLNIRSDTSSGTSGTIELGIYDITSGANNAPLLYTNTVTVDRAIAGVYSVTGLGVDFSAHSGKTLGIAHCRGSVTITGARNAATGNSRSSDVTTSLADPFVQNDTSGIQMYGLWAELIDAPTGGKTLIDVDIPSDIDLLWGQDYELAVTHDDGTTTLANVTLEVPTGWQIVSFNSTPNTANTESAYEHAINDSGVGNFTMVNGDVFAWESQPGLTFDGQTKPTVSPAATVSGQYKIWSSTLESWSPISTFVINDLGVFVGIGNIGGDNEIEIEETVTMSTVGTPNAEPSEWSVTLGGLPMTKVGWNNGDPQVKVASGTSLAVNTSYKLVLSYKI